MRRRHISRDGHRNGFHRAHTAANNRVMQISIDLKTDFFTSAYRNPQKQSDILYSVPTVFVRKDQSVGLSP